MGWRTQLANQVRVLLMEYWIVLPLHVGQVRRGLPVVWEGLAGNRSPYPDQCESRLTAGAILPSHAAARHSMLRVAGRDTRDPANP